jgi:hypothetical protein
VTGVHRSTLEAVILGAVSSALVLAGSWLVVRQDLAELWPWLGRLSAIDLAALALLILAASFVCGLSLLALLAPLLGHRRSGGGPRCPGCSS